MTPPLVTVVGTSKGAPGGGVITSYPPPLSPILVSPARNTNNHRDQAGAGELSSPAILNTLRDGEIVCKSGRRILKNGQKWQALANNVLILRVPRNQGTKHATDGNTINAGDHSCRVHHGKVFSVWAR